MATRIWKIISRLNILNLPIEKQANEDGNLISIDWGYHVLKYELFWMNIIKELFDSAFVRYDEFLWRLRRTNSFRDMHNSLYLTELRPIIAKLADSLRYPIVFIEFRFCLLAWGGNSRGRWKRGWTVSNHYLNKKNLVFFQILLKLETIT